MRVALLRVTLSGLILMGVAGVAGAQVDLSGEWALRMHEDQPWRGPGQLPGEFQGIPINAEARAKAESWMASVYTIPERQCIPFSVDMAYTFGNMRIWKIKDAPSQEVIAFGQHNEWQAQERTIWMDGRPHPPVYAPHSWQGFSTGRWDGNILHVTTTHLKEGFLRRNGVALSDRATMTEYLVRHGNYLTSNLYVEDPVYLTEPFLTSTTWVLDAGLIDLQRRYPCGPNEITVEIVRDRGVVPHLLPGTNIRLFDFATRFGLPRAAAAGGRETLYPEYARTLPGAHTAVPAR